MVMVFATAACSASCVTIMPPCKQDFSHTLLALCAKSTGCWAQWAGSLSDLVVRQYRPN